VTFIYLVSSSSGVENWPLLDSARR